MKKDKIPFGWFPHHSIGLDVLFGCCLTGLVIVVLVIVVSILK